MPINHGLSEIFQWNVAPVVRRAGMRYPCYFARSGRFLLEIPMRTTVPATIAFLSMLATQACTQSQETEHLTIYAAAAVKTSLTEIVEDFEQSTGNTVDVVFDSAGATLRHYLDDPSAGLFITTPSRIESAQADGTIPVGTIIELGSTVAGVAVPPGTPKPDISTAANLRAALLAADKIAFSDPSRGATVGNHFMAVIETLGIKDEVLAKAVLAPNGVETMRLVLEDGVDIGITQSVEVMQANRDALAGGFPGEFELRTTYSLWHQNDISPAAQALIDAILSPAGRALIAAEGLEVPAN